MKQRLLNIMFIPTHTDGFTSLLINDVKVGYYVLMASPFGDNFYYYGYLGLNGIFILAANMFQCEALLLMEIEKHFSGTIHG